MHIIKILYLIFLLLLFPVGTNAQELGVKLIGSPRQDSILLRWAPINPASWRLGNEYGYIVKRYTILKNKKIPNPIPVSVLNKEVLKPAPIEVWAKYADDKYMAITAECIYGSYYKDIHPPAGIHISLTKSIKRKIIGLVLHYMEQIKI
jgi:hypothetical protein